MTDELAQIIHENFNKCRGRNGVPPSALAEVIESSDWLRKVKADTLREFAKTLDTYSGTVLNADSAANMARVTANSIEGVSR